MTMPGFEEAFALCSSGHQEFAITKDQVPQQLVEAIRRVADGQEGVFSKDVERTAAERRSKRET